MGASSTEAVDRGKYLWCPFHMAAPAILIDDPIFSLHRARDAHPERPERLAAARRACELAKAQVTWANIAPRDAASDELRRVHTEGYLHTLGQAAGKWGMLDADTFYCPESVAAATRAAGAALGLVDELLAARARWGVALVRPPGHHARPDQAMGFCLLNNVAVAAAHARAKGLQRVAILDFDVHHGNGTQEIFYQDPSVLYLSLHQFPYYPGTGDATESGAGEGRGYTVNVPLSAGAGDAVYLAAFERIISPIIEQYRPELLLLSAGFDAHERDPLGGMALTDDGYFALARSFLSGLGPETPVGVVLEGGYDLSGLEGALSSTIAALCDGPADATVSREVSPAFERELARAAHAQGAHWRLGR